MNIRAQIFGQNRLAESPLVSAKKPKGAKAEALLSIAIPRSEHRRGDMRVQDRYPLFDPARMAWRGGSYEIELINVCGGGAMIAAAVEVPLWDRLELQLGEHGTIECTVIWTRHGRMGVEFAEETRLDCAEDEKSDLLRQAIMRHFPEARFDTPKPIGPAAAPASQDHRGERRHPLIWSGTLHYDYRSTSARLRNISAAGAMVETALELLPGNEPLLDLGEAGAIFGTVAWISGDQVGLRFQQPFDMASLANAKPRVADGKWEAPAHLRSHGQADSGWEGQWKRMTLNEIEGK